MGKNAVSISGPKSGDANNGQLTGTCINAVDGGVIKVATLVTIKFQLRLLFSNLCRLICIT
jgi:hypothetical protein